VKPAVKGGMRIGVLAQSLERFRLVFLHLPSRPSLLPAQSPERR
jgi:hypothetical protein